MSHPQLAFVYERFNNWKKALSAFDRHEKSVLHRSALQLIPKKRKETILELSHKRKIEVMKENRVALEKSLRFLGCQGLAIRGKEVAGSNLAMLLQERMEDVVELKQWLKRKGKIKYLSPAITNEI